MEHTSTGGQEQAVELTDRLVSRTKIDWRWVVVMYGDLAADGTIRDEPPSEEEERVALEAAEWVQEMETRGWRFCCDRGWISPSGRARLPRCLRPRAVGHPAPRSRRPRDRRRARRSGSRSRDRPRREPDEPDLPRRRGLESGPTKGAQP